MGKWLAAGNAKKPGSLVQTAYEEGCLISASAFVDSSAGFGLVKHTSGERMKAGKPYLTIDAVADFRELTNVKIAAGATGLFMVGGGVSKNFAQDTVACAEILGQRRLKCINTPCRSPSPTCADGFCSSSTLKEACSWGKGRRHLGTDGVRRGRRRLMPLIASDAWHRGSWKTRTKRRWAKLFDKEPA